MLSVIEGIMDVAFIGFAVYGIIVFRKWHKVAVKTDSMLDEMKKELSDDGKCHYKEDDYEQ